MFSTLDFNADSIYGRVQSLIGLDGKRWWRLAGAILLPIVILAAASIKEGCFLLGSVFTEGVLNGKECHLVGMSFLGDPMVWGFMILVPALVVTLKLATERTITLVNTVAAKASPAWKEDDSPEGLQAVMRNTQDIWNMRASDPGWVRRLLLWGPWVAASAFWLYNTATCAFHPWLPDSYYPYQSELVAMVTSNDPASTEPSPGASNAGSNEAPTLRFQFDGDWQDTQLAKTNGTARIVALSNPVPLKKWDCQPQAAPLSCWLTRIWTLLYYGVIPFLLRHLLLLIWGATYFLNSGARWEERMENRQDQAVEINPFHPDGFGGLGALSDSVIGYLYSFSGFAMLLGLAFLKEGNQPSWHNYAMILAFLPIGMWGVLAPSVAVRHTILNAKSRYLGQLAGELHSVGNSILTALPKGTLAKELSEKELDKQHKAVRGLYDEVSAMSEWPFSVVTLVRMVLPIAAPWLPAVIKELAGVYLK